MLEMLLVPLLGLALFAVPLMGDDAPADEETPADPETPIDAETPGDADTPVDPVSPDPEDPTGADLAQRTTDGTTLTGAAAGVSESGTEGLLSFSGTDSADVLEVGDGETRFSVDPGAGADQITVGLNSDVTMGEAEFGNPVTTFPSEAQGLLDRVVTTQDIADLDADEITLAVTEAGLANVPAGGAQIDLSDPDDALIIDLPETLEGNLHLVEVSSEEESEDGSTLTRYTLAVLSDSEVTELSEEVVDALVNEEAGEDAPTVLARIEQGSQTVTAIDSLPDVESNDIARQSDLNTTPLITSNRAITSETEVDLQPA